MSSTSKINMSRPSTENSQPFSLIEPIDIVSTLSQPMLGILIFAIGIYSKNSKNSRRLEILYKNDQ